LRRTDGITLLSYCPVVFYLKMRALGVFSKSLAVARAAVAPVRASVRFASTAKAAPGSKGRVVLLYRCIGPHRGHRC